MQGSQRKFARLCAVSLILSFAFAARASERNAKHDLHASPGVWSAQWIAAPWSTERDGAEADGSRPMPVFRREFTLRAKPVEAVLRIAGMGQWQASLGQSRGAVPVAPEGLHQDWTDYRKTVTYSTFDVRGMLGPGKAVLTVMLGNGMYNVQRTALPNTPRGARYTKFAGSFGAPKLTAELTLRYADGKTETIATDTEWKAERGPVVFDSAYGGEDFDARRESPEWKLPGFDDSRWNSAQIVSGPGGAMAPSIAPLVGTHEIYTPVHQSDPGNGRTVYDLGQNFAGIVKVRVQGPAGAILRLTPGELLNADGTVSQATFHGPMWWSYTLRGDRGGETWQPLFGYEGFRYVQAEWTPGPGMAEAKQSVPLPAGTLQQLTGIAQYSDSEVTGSFVSSSDMLNRIHHLIVAAMHNNSMSLLTDCPHREKLGWLEQAHLQAPSMMFNNNLQMLFRATDMNMADAQWADGIVPTIAPEYTKFGPKSPVFDDSPEWGSASVLEPWWTYTFYGEPTQLAKDYPVMQRYVQALAGKAKDGVVEYGLGDWYDIGPGGPGMEKNTSLGVTGTLMLYEDAVAMQHMATLLGHTEDATHYAALAKATADAFNRKFWDEAHHWYDRGSQTANAMPLALGVVPSDRQAEVLAHVVDDIHAHTDHVTAGEIGYPYLLRALSQAGRDDVIMAMLMRKDPPSYGSQLERGATALTEAWDANPHNSQDHLMLGGADEWFYRRLGGVDIDMSRAKKETRLTLHPALVNGVDWVKCGYKSVLGKVESDWKRDATGISFDFTVPSESTVILPSGTETKPGHGVQVVAKSAGEVVYKVQPGTHHFHVAGLAGR